jgi:hypothetical protein
MATTEAETNEYYPARNKAGNEIKGMGAKHIVTQIIRLRRKGGSEFLYSLGYDAFGNMVARNCAKPEVLDRILFNYQRVYDPRTTVKDEVEGKVTSLRREPNINDTLKLFQKPFDYLYHHHTTPQQ